MPAMVLPLSWLAWCLEAGRLDGVAVMLDAGAVVAAGAPVAVALATVAVGVEELLPGWVVIASAPATTASDTPALMTPTRWSFQAYRSSEPSEAKRFTGMAVISAVARFAT
jgi:hypothetical protein